MRACLWCAVLRATSRGFGAITRPSSGPRHRRHRGVGVVARGLAGSLALRSDVGTARRTTYPASPGDRRPVLQRTRGVEIIVRVSQTSGWSIVLSLSNYSLGMVPAEIHNRRHHEPGQGFTRRALEHTAEPGCSLYHRLHPRDGLTDDALVLRSLQTSGTRSRTSGGGAMKT